MNTKKILKAFVYILPVLVIVPLIFVNFAGAQGGLQPTPNSPIQNISDIIGVVNFLLRLVFTLFLIVAIFYVLKAGFMYLKAEGDPGKVSKASNQLIYAAVAVAVSLVAFGIRSIVENVLQQRG